MSCHCSPPATISFQVIVERDKIYPDPPFLQSKQPHLAAEKASCTLRPSQPGLIFCETGFCYKILVATSHYLKEVQLDYWQLRNKFCEDQTQNYSPQPLQGHKFLLGESMTRAIAENSIKNCLMPPCFSL